MNSRLNLNVCFHPLLACLLEVAHIGSSLQVPRKSPPDSAALVEETGSSQRKFEFNSSFSSPSGLEILVSSKQPIIVILRFLGSGDVEHLNSCGVGNHLVNTKFSCSAKQLSCGCSVAKICFQSNRLVL